MKPSWQGALQILCSLAGDSQRSLTDRHLQQVVVDLNQGIATCDGHGQVRRAEQIFRGMQEVQVRPSLVTYNVVLRVYQKSSLADKALDILEEMEGIQVKPDLISYSSAISACEKGHMVKEAFEIFREMQLQQINPNLISYSALMSACEKCSCASAAGQTLSQLIRVRLRPDVISFNAAIRAFAKVSDVTAARKILRKMRKHQVQPNVVSLNSLLSAYDAPGRGLSVNDTDSIMKELTSEAVMPNVVTFSTLINAYEKHSLWDVALATLAKVKASRLIPNRVAYTSALGACRRDPSSAPLLYAEMKRDMVEMDVVAYNGLIAVWESNPRSRSLCSFGFQMLQDMKENRVAPDILSFNSLLNICRSVGDVASARGFYAGLLKQRLQADAITLDAVIQTLEMVLPPDARLLNCLDQTGCRYLTSLATSHT